LSSFAPFKKPDEKKWGTDNAIGANMQIDIKLALGAIDYAMVVVSKQTSNEWVFSTVRGGSGYGAVNDRNKPGAHPVSGNRAFGFQRDASGRLIFYVMGADRATRSSDAVGGVAIGFEMADKLWRSYQDRIVAFVNSNGGVARIDDENTISKRNDWDVVKLDPTIYDISDQPDWVRLFK
jgi:hypothetical protein